jgi:hypothetical protein
MKAALIDKFGDNDRVRLAKVPRPTPTGSIEGVEVGRDGLATRLADPSLRSG